MKKEVYVIEGMSCAACSAAVERVTNKLDGVEQSSVNLTTNKMNISYDETKVTQEQIIKKVEKAGFGIKKLEKANKKTSPKLVEDEEEKKDKETKHNVIGAIIFSIVLMYVAMGHMAKLPIIDIVSKSTHPINWAILQILLTIPVMFFGRKYIVNGFKALIHLNPNMDSLVALSCTTSFTYSLLVTFLISDYPKFLNNLYFDAAAMVLTFISIGKFLEGNSKRKTKEAIKKLIELTPDTAILVTDYEGQKYEEVKLEQIKIDDIVLVKAGSKIPLDGTIIKGEASIDLSMLTGESIPVEKKIGDEVVGGSINTNGTIFVKISRVGEDTTLAKIIKFVEEAQGKKAPISKIADKVAGIFVPIVMVIAIGASVIWILLGQDIGFSLNIFTSVLVIACPCALGLATPTAIMVGTGVGAKNGMLIRSGETLELINKAKVVVMDKTGTITEGVPKVTKIITKDISKEEIILIAGAIENNSEHPLAKAIVTKMEEMNLNNTYKVNEVKILTGMGIKATINDGRNVYIGNAKLMKQNKISIENFAKNLEDIAKEGQTPMCIAFEGEVKGIIAVADTIKESSKEAVKKLKEEGIKVVMLTGDNKFTAKSIANEVGITDIESEVLPEDKAKIVEKYQKNGNVVIMAGDGINDAPALVQADIGVAIGNGSDIAIESADVVLIKNDLRDIHKTYKLSTMTIRNIKQNLFWAFFYNSLGIPLAAGVFFSSLGILLNPMVGSFAMSLSSICVVSNALRLRNKKLS